MNCANSLIESIGFSIIIIKLVNGMSAYQMINLLIPDNQLES